MTKVPKAQNKEAKPLDISDMLRKSLSRQKHAYCWEKDNKTLGRNNELQEVI